VLLKEYELRTSGRGARSPWQTGGTGGPPWRTSGTGVHSPWQTGGTGARSPWQTGGISARWFSWLLVSYSWLLGYKCFATGKIYLLLGRCVCVSVCFVEFCCANGEFQFIHWVPL
jgi:hypothetical protein